MKSGAHVVVVGAGPGGCAAAMTLLAAGVRVTLVEQAVFPRFHVGESMTGECGKTVRELGLADLMDSAAMGRIVKRGTRVYGRQGASFYVPVMDRDPDGRLTPSTTWQVKRSTFDAMLLDEAVERGAELVRGQATGCRSVTAERGGQTVELVAAVQIDRSAGGTVSVPCDVVIDASGQGRFLSRAGVLGKPERGRYDKQIAVACHVSGARCNPEPEAGDTLIFVREKDHWAWFIPIEDDVVSIGIVTPGEHYRRLALGLDAFYERELTALHPDLADRVQDCELIEGPHAVSNYSYAIGDGAGPNAMAIGDARRFIDPVLSFGLHFAMKEGVMAGRAVADHLADAEPSAAPFAGLHARCEGGMDVIQDVIDAFWGEPLMFAACVHHVVKDDMIDLLAGRVYTPTPTRGMKAMRQLAERSRGAVA